MGRKSNTKDHVPALPEANPTNHDDTKGIYRKRLRSWKQTSSQMKSNHLINDEVTPLCRSTIYTYPINLNNDRQNSLSRTMLSENLTTDESAFYCPSISYTSIQTIGDLNNNHVTTMHIEKKKRKNNSVSCESLSSQFSQGQIPEILSNPNDTKIIGAEQSSTNNLLLTYHQSPTKRSRFSTRDSIITHHRSVSSPLMVDDNIIDINQLDQEEPLISSMINDSLINNSNSMEAAVKMVQPIVDIIFNAFEDQLKNAQSKTIQSSPLNSSSISPQFHSPMMIPYFPLTSPARPLVLHVVNFNIQLTAKQPTINSVGTRNSLTNTRLIKNDNSQSTSLTELKQKVLSYILPNNLTTDDQTHYVNQGKRHQLKRIVQLAAVGVSALCGYLLL